MHRRKATWPSLRYVPLTFSFYRAHRHWRCTGASYHPHCCRPSCSCVPSLRACPEAHPPHLRCSPWPALEGALAAAHRMWGSRGRGACFDRCQMPALNQHNAINQRPEADVCRGKRVWEDGSTWLATGETRDSNRSPLGSHWGEDELRHERPRQTLRYQPTSDWLTP
jgi:hypothetical protein